VDARWKIICQKKENLENLRPRLTEAQHELDLIRPEFLSDRKWRRSPEYYTAQSKITNLKNMISSEETAPPKIIQPLPLDEREGYEWIFYLFMPAHLKFISTFTILCKQLIVPNDKETLKKCRQIPEQTNISSHYSSHASNYSSHPSPSCNIGSSSTVPTNFGNRNVYEITDRYDGVFHPDAWRLSIRCDTFNPFHPQISKMDINRNFTETLPERSQNLEWALLMNPSPERGNIGIATQSKSPKWLSKTEYLNFTSLRAFPSSQLRKLATCLHERALPFERIEVQILVRQLLYHVGPMNLGGTMEWRGDSVSSVMSTILGEVSVICIEWREKQRDSAGFLLFAEIAAYLSQFDSICENTVDAIVAILGEWTSSLQRTISKNHNPSEICKLRLRQCVYNMYAVICLGGNRPLSQAQLEVLCRLSLLIRFGLPAKDLVDDSMQIAELLDLCYYTLVVRLKELLSFIAAQPSSLTRAVQCIIETTPNHVKWSCVPSMEMCFETCDDCRNHYAVNILTGVVLLNGDPPRSLPNEILDHPLYRRSFGDVNFETLLLSNGWIESSRPVYGRKYRLRYDSDSKLLLIQERRIGDDEDSFLQLVDANNRFKYFPSRLLEMHSHWYNPFLNTLVLRPIDFRKRNIHFIVREITSKKPLVYCVPIHKQIEEDIWRDRVQDCEWDQLVPKDPRIVQVISKFEPEEYLHFYQTPRGETKIDFPRYHLSFEYSEAYFHSLDYPSMRLSRSQQFPHTLASFSKYLILECTSDENERKILIPHGKIELQNDVNIVIPNDCGISCSYYSYSVHQRFGTLESSDIESRIYLACLYAACSTHLPDFLCGMTGEEYSMTLLRQCHLSRPLCGEEIVHLTSCSKFVKHAPALHLLCLLLWKTSEQLSFLFPNHKISSCVFDDLRSNAEIAYINQIRDCNPRKRLLPTEENILFGYDTIRLCGPKLFSKMDLIDIKDLCIDSDFVMKYENALNKSCVDLESNSQSTNPEFPINLKLLQRSCLEDEYFENLEKSWSSYFQSKAEAMRIANYQWQSSEVKKKRLEVESFLLCQIGKIPSTPDRINFRKFRLIKHTIRIPRLSSLDLAKIALNPKMLEDFNPCFSMNSQEILLKVIILWMELCVLEDKIFRMDALLINLNSTEELLIRENLRREILTTRTWDSSKHVSWLVFEVIGRLQIRPHQYAAVQSLIQNPGMISQINMGEGKTRVLLPMLCLYFSRHSEAVVRIIMLSNILEEGYEYLHRYLCASVFNMRIVLIPFDRNIELSHESASLLLHTLQSIKGQRACVIMSPESWLSFQLKLDELSLYEDQDEILPILKQIEDLEFCDFLDESDEELSHKYRLIYSIGSQVGLSSGPLRWECVLHLLWLVSFSPKIVDLIRRIGFFSSEGKPLCSFQYFYLTTNNISQIWAEIIKQLADSVLQKPPHILRWISRASNMTRKKWLEYLTNPDCAFELDDQILQKENRMDAMYALRGFLAHGLLKTCLQSRHRVQYGVCRPHPQGKRMAIPFRANNVPAERSEFKQPDVALIYTCLSYFSDGLSLEETREALKMLLSLGSNAQSHEYELWLKMHSHIPPSVFERLDHVNKIDISNQDQLVELHKYFGINIYTISFWLRYILFPTETPQHIQSIQRTPWHLCNGRKGEVRGFSGTNDTRFLLPLHVRQESFDEICDIERKSSSGKMIHLLMEKSSQFLSMPPSVDGITVQWKKLLAVAIRLATHALIDTGALLAGISNVEAADFILSLPKSTFRGVLYFEITKKSWMVKTGTGQMWSLRSSPIQPIDCFTIFDEGRCRGADIVLKSGAIGLVTLGPKMTKDKLMQGLGRLRMLDRTQSVMLIGSEDVAHQISQINSSSHPAPVSISFSDVLQWVIRNTINMIRDGFVEWGVLGAHYCFADRELGQISLHESLSCKDFYSGRNQYSSLFELYQNKIKKFKVAMKISVPVSENYLSKIESKIKKFDNFPSAQFSSTLEEECEKELEKEKEVEVEIEVEIETQNPATEMDWNYSSVGRWKTEDYLRHNVITTLSQAIQANLRYQNGRSSISWPTNIYCTMNFANTIATPRRSVFLNNYLRPVDAILRVNNDLILISDRELNAVLPHFWASTNARNGETNTHLMNFTYLKASHMDRISLSLNFGSAPFENAIQDSLVLALQIFDGEPMYGSRGSSLPKLLPTPDSGKKNAVELVSMRGKGHLLDKSDLDFFDTD
jgi:hypothetical protein